jgi:hypothetical protein
MSYSSTFFDEIAQESLASAKVVVPLVVDLVHPATVVDVGCATVPGYLFVVIIK